MMSEKNKVFSNCWELLEEHECQDWEEFREFVKYVTDDYADIGHIGSDSCSDCGGFENLEEMTAIFFLTEDGVGNILSFPITFEEFTEEIEKNGIFKDQ